MSADFIGPGLLDDSPRPARRSAHGPVPASRPEPAGRSGRDSGCSGALPPRSSSVNASGTQSRNSGLRNVNVSGSTPTTVYRSSFSSSSRPTMPSTPPGCRLANVQLRTVTRLRPGVPSSSVKSRPRAADAFSTVKNDGVTFIDATPSAPAPWPTRNPPLWYSALALEDVGERQAIEIVGHRCARALDAGARETNRRERPGDRTRDTAADAAAPNGPR